MNEFERELKESEDIILPQEDAEAKEFLKRYPIAEKFTDDICKCFSEDETLSGSDGLKCALIKVLSKNYRTGESYASDNDFLEKYIYGNDSIKKRIIEDYLNSLKTSPAISFKKGALPCTEADKPETVRAAGELARAFFKRNKK